jgi:signal transduction histidine kinase/FixJ family two-component response regulator
VDADVIPEPLFVVAGEMGTVMAATDWRATPLGDPAGWAPALRTAAGVCLECRFPMLIMWGPELAMIYNDAFRPILAEKHPRSMGQAGAECWAEIWDEVGLMLRGVLESATTIWSEDQLMVLDRRGFDEDCYFTFSYSPIRSQVGDIEGVLVTVFETTEQVVGERRMSCLRELAEARADARSPSEVIERAAAVLDRFAPEVPFACLYLIDEGREVQGAAFAGLVEAVPAQAWPLPQLIASRSEVHIDGVDEVVRTVQTEPTARSALALPVLGGVEPELRAVLVAGLHPRRAFDAEYRSFLALVVEDLAAGLASARVREQERAQAQALAALDEAKTRFFSNVSHEFRTPLTLLLGPLDDLLSGDEPLSEGQRRALLLGRRNALRMRRLVNALLDLTQAEAGSLAPSFRPLDLAQYTTELASTFESAVASAGLELRVACRPLDGPAYVDIEMWEKIVLNLLSNALKHTWQGSIAVRLSSRGGSAELQVSDTGIGIAEEELPRLFERFHQAKGVRARSAEGSGIGLALVSELVGLHEGEVSVQSEVGRGTTFTVRIPLRPKAAGTAGRDRVGERPSASMAAQTFLAEAERWAAADDGIEDSGPAGSIPGGVSGGRVLVVDDNSEMRSYLRRVLAGHFEVETVPDGQAALAAIQSSRPDLVLTDVMMPELDGFEFLEAIRADPQTARLPVIMLSARAGQESSVGGLDAGADDYLVKPFSTIELIARVRSNLTASRAREEAALQAARRAERLGQLVQAGIRVAACVEPDEVLEALAGEACRLFDAHEVLVVDDEGHERTSGTLRTGSADHAVQVDLAGEGSIRLLLPMTAEFDAEDRALCEQLAVVGAAALARARLHQAEHRALRRLQACLLPRELPTHPSLQLAVRYLPANTTADIGGDWYDVISLPGGRLAAVVGDVVGHGMEAAAAMSSLRNVLRAFLIEGDDAGRALARMHELANRTGAGLTATLCCAIIDPAAGIGDWASAGHPPPLLVGSDGTAAYLEAGPNQQPALGVGTRPAATQSGLVVAPGEMLLLYTDGLVERRDRADGVALLQRRRPCDGIDLDTYCDALIDELAPIEVRRDDVALLALRRTPSSESVLELRPPAVATAARETRRRLRPWLAAHSFDPDAASDAVVAVSEAVVNAVEHSGITPNEQLTVRARLASGRLDITVRDTGRWRRTREDPLRGFGLKLMRSLMDTVNIDERGDGTRVELTLTADPS